MSGGGFRAALFHAGVLRALYEQRQIWCGDNADKWKGSLPETILSSVSGGAIISAIWGLPAMPSFFDSYGPEKVLSQVIISSPFSKIGGVISLPVLENSVQRVQLLLGRILSVFELLPILGGFPLWRINFIALRRHLSKHLERTWVENGPSRYFTERPVRLGHLMTHPIPIFQTLNLSRSGVTFWQSNYIGDDPDRIFSTLKAHHLTDPIHIHLAEVVALSMAHLGTTGPVKTDLNNVGEFHGDAGILDNMALAVLVAASLVNTPRRRPTFSPIDKILISDAGAASAYHKRGIIDSRIKASLLNITQTELANLQMAGAAEALLKHPRGLINPGMDWHLLRNQEALQGTPTGFQKIPVQKQAEVLYVGYTEAMATVFPDVIPKICSSEDYRRLCKTADKVPTGSSGA